MTYREEQFMKQMTEIAIEVAELRAENKLLKSFNDTLIQALHKPVVVYKNKKIRVKWTPDLEQDLDTMTTKGSIMYDEEYSNKIIEEFGSVENYKKSDVFIKLKADFDAKLNKS